MYIIPFPPIHTYSTLPSQVKLMVCKISPHWATLRLRQIVPDRYFNTVNIYISSLHKDCLMYTRQHLISSITFSHQRICQIVIDKLNLILVLRMQWCNQDLNERVLNYAHATEIRPRTHAQCAAVLQALLASWSGLTCHDRQLSRSNKVFNVKARTDKRYQGLIRVQSY